jgi:hypothetical protein
LGWGVPAQQVVPPINAPYQPFQSVMPSFTNFDNAFTNTIALSSPTTVSGQVAGSSLASVSSQAAADMTESSEEDDTATADENGITSAEEDDADVTSTENEDDDTSSADNDIFLTDNYRDGTSSVEVDKDAVATAPVYRSESTYDNITNIRPANERPNISLELVRDSNVASKLPGFLAQLRAANEELEEEKSAGSLANHRIEIDESDSAAEGEQHIELNLGLGVLEEKSYEGSTTTESDSSNDEGDSHIMEKLLGGKMKRSIEDGDESAPKKVKIQEV